MKLRILELFIALEKAIPPPVGHHSITLARYGSDLDGWEDRLSLNIRTPEGAQAMFLEDADFEKPVHELVAEVSRLIAERPANAQTMVKPI